MKIFNIFVVSKFVYSSDPFFVNEVVILENNYWGKEKAQIKTKEGFLNIVVVEMINTKKQDLFESLIIPSDCYYDPKKKRYLFVISSGLTNKILSKINSKHEDNYAILNFQYFYSDKQLKDDFSMADYKGKLFFFENYKILINETDDTIKFKDDDIKSYICHVKQMMQNLFNCKYVVLEDFDKDLIDQDLNVPFYFFNSQRSCYENFEKFIAFLNFLRLENEGTELGENDDNLLKMSFLNNYLRNKFNLDYKNKKDVKIFQFYDRIDSFFEQCCYEIKEQLTNHKIILPIKKPLTAEFYLDQFYELIKEAIESSFNNINQNYCENVPATFCACFLVFKRDLKKMCRSIINNTWKSLCVLDYFNKLFGREVLSEKDFMDVDKIICDFFNVMRCVNKAKNDQIRTTDINLANPMLKDKFECRFIKALEITVAKSVEFGRIKAIGLKGKDISIEESVDYYVRCYENISTIVFLFVNIRTKNIQELKIISDDGKYIENIKVGKYLKY